MKKLSAIYILVFVALCTTNLSARPEAQITIHVITDEGKPVQNAPLLLTSFDHWQPGEGFGQDIITNSRSRIDNNGYAIVKEKIARGDIQFDLYQVPGYYTGGSKYQFKSVVGDKWQPWNPTVELIVRPIIKPIPMYARTVREALGGPVIIPATNVPVGFDLEVGDWVAPYGKGSISDFIFTKTDKAPFTEDNQPFDVIWALSFSNKGDGIKSVLVPANSGSVFRLPRIAPEIGYQSSLIQEISYDGKQWKKGAVGEDQNYFYRVRTVLDEQGNVKSALYGKISGPISYGGYGLVRFTYYLNPNSNDRNMEFDPTKNLFQNLSDDQQVTAP